MTDEPAAAQAGTLVAEVFAPAPLVLSLLLLAGWAGDGLPGMLWGLGTAALVASLPMLVLRELARRGPVDGHFVRSRAQRLPAYAATAALTTLVVGVGLWLGAPPAVPWTAAFVLAGMLVLLVVTLWWKVSAHVAMASCWAVALGAVTVPGAVVVALPVPIAVAVSRLRSGDHTPAQTAAGALIGVLIGLAYAATAATVL